MLLIGYKADGEQLYEIYKSYKSFQDDWKVSDGTQQLEFVAFEGVWMDFKNIKELNTYLLIMQQFTDNF